MNNKITITLGEVASVQTGPFGSQLHMSDYKSEGTPIITVEHLGENKIIHNNLPLVSDEDKLRLIKYTLKEGDIVFSRVGSVDRRAYVSVKENDWLFSGRCLRVRAKKDCINSKFLSFYFGQESFKETIRVLAVGATMPSINTAILSDIQLSLPPLPEQQAIAEVLSSLDDKIDLLHRNNKTLEEMAETLFRQWFVEEAKEDWEETTLDRQINLVGGGTPKTAIPEYWDGDVNWLSGGDISNAHKGFVLDTEKKISETGLTNSSCKLLEKYGVVISARGTVGKYCLLGREMAFSQSNYGVLPIVDGAYFYNYLLIAHCVDDLLQAAYGSVFDTITTSTFKGINLRVPPESGIREFNQLVMPLFEKILFNTQQLNKLRLLRDTLLPKLMSGQVRVKS